MYFNDPGDPKFLSFTPRDEQDPYPIRNSRSSLYDGSTCVYTLKSICRAQCGVAAVRQTAAVRHHF